MKLKTISALTKLMVVVGLAIACPTAFAQYKPFIDSNYAKEQAELKAKTKTSCDPSKPIKYVKCAKQTREEWEKIHPNRGTPEYAELHYSKLTEAEAKAKVKELYAQSENARLFGVKPEPGEVVREDFEAEAMWIRVSILHEKLLDPSRVKVRE